MLARWHWGLHFHKAIKQRANAKKGANQSLAWRIGLGRGLGRLFSLFIMLCVAHSCHYRGCCSRTTPERQR